MSIGGAPLVGLDARRLPSSALFRVLAILPMTLKPIAAEHTWRVRFDEGIGPLRDLLARGGVGSVPRLSHDRNALASLIAVDA